MAEAVALPRGSWRRSWRAMGIGVAALACVFSVVLLASARPGFAALVTASLVALLAIVSNAKHESLREPFVFTDLSLFSQLFAHPRLYLPFLSAGKVVAIAIGAALFVAAFIFGPKPPRHSDVSLAIVVLLSFAAVVRLSSRLDLSLLPESDQRRHGFLSTFVAYLSNGLRPATARLLRSALATGPFARTASRLAGPDIIVIQSESFFDARRLGNSVDSSLLKHFDIACHQSEQYGELTVPAWGANTMRTEFAVLTGLNEAQLGYARFYPYAFVRSQCTTMAAWFKRAGYVTRAIHPYFADFFGRARVFPLMHFDTFTDIGAFDTAPRAGPHVADAAVADAILEALDTAGDQPAFVMAMTMENHGPLHLEDVNPGEAARYHSQGEDPRWNDLTAYLRHLSNADVMIGRLMQALAQRPRESIVCFYGDHVPALPKIFDSLNQPQLTSDYFIWRSHGTRTEQRTSKPSSKPLSAARLGPALVELVEEMHGVVSAR
ncbi:LTA synthase family protein [Burkholderia sp. PAMC 26561]|uniref:LTA synthase family protein n=1 Tax=Burkholderia sp. PAMC 26561 TaxID=1795043 RepID=UPI00076B3589|nr:LTA synthase family protein [Burkholderia sp. PAMC 26561]AME25101.1 capsular biosynthesis protein [Burkholderia sp. PAMC 26561]